jgi:hypothetical protein
MTKPLGLHNASVQFATQKQYKTTQSKSYENSIYIKCYLTIKLAAEIILIYKYFRPLLCSSEVKNKVVIEPSRVEL